VKLREKPFVYYEDVHSIVGRDTATSEHALSSNMQEQVNEFVKDQVDIGNYDVVGSVGTQNTFTSSSATGSIPFDNTGAEDVWTFLRRPYTDLNLFVRTNI
jgi:hypothetical protein